MINKCSLSINCDGQFLPLQLIIIILPIFSLRVKSHSLQEGLDMLVAVNAISNKKINFHLVVRVAFNAIYHTKQNLTYFAL